MIPEPLQYNFPKILSYFFKKEVSTLKWGWFKMLVNFEIKREIETLPYLMADKIKQILISCYVVNIAILIIIWNIFLNRKSLS